MAQAEAMLTIRTSKCNTRIKKPPQLFFFGFIIQNAGLSAIQKLGRSLVRYRDPERYLNKVEVWSYVSMEDGGAPTTVL